MILLKCSKKLISILLLIICVSMFVYPMLPIFATTETSEQQNLLTDPAAAEESSDLYYQGFESSDMSADSYLTSDSYEIRTEQEAVFSIENQTLKSVFQYKNNNHSYIRYKGTAFNKNGSLSLSADFKIENPSSLTNWIYAPMAFNFDNSSSSVYGQIVTVFARDGCLWAKNTSQNSTAFLTNADKICDISFGTWYNLELILDIVEGDMDYYYYILTDKSTGKVYTNQGLGAKALGQCWDPWTASNCFKNGNTLNYVSFSVSQPLQALGTNTITAYLDNVRLRENPLISVTANVDSSKDFDVTKTIELTLEEGLPTVNKAVVGLDKIVLSKKNSNGEFEPVDVVRAYDSTNKKITLNADLWYSSDYKITIPSGLYSDKGSCIAGNAIEFKTITMKKDLKLTNLKLNGNVITTGDSIAKTGNVNIEATLTNSGDNSNQPASLIAVVYDNGIMKACGYAKKNIALGATETLNLNMALPNSISANAKIRIFTWDNLKEKNAMSNETVVNITE